MKTWQLIVVGIGIHLVFFYSIFDIYFTSPIVHGMTPHASTHPPPARRLVLFSVDGLRADKMLELEFDGNTRVPYLRKIIETRGAWGVSHTRVPTESRPGHVALIAGLYEDVSAVAKGWKENPVEFDSVFNESRYTWSWGSPDILPMFSKGASGDHVFTSCYPAHFEDFASSDSTMLDTWVFDGVKKFFQEAENDVELKEKLNQDKIVFFLHLLGMDTNGHVNKPYSREYIENIRYIDKGIRQMEELIEGYYGNDGRTAYVMSSDHGMTDWGSHGAGHPSETLTPIVAWGAGVRGPQKPTQSNRYQDGFSEDWSLDHIERNDIQQADVAPLMSALVGVNYPMNSVGVLPWQYLNLSHWEIAELMYANLQQILAQYEVKQELKRSTTLALTFRQFSYLTPAKMADIHRHIRSLIQSGQYLDVITECERVMELALKGLNYYQTYDRFFLGTSIFFGFVGWMTYILTLVMEAHSGVVRSKVKVDRLNQPYWKSDRAVTGVYFAVAMVITVLLFIQSLPWTNYLYCLIPVVLWMFVTLRGDMLTEALKYMLTVKGILPVILTIGTLAVGLEILVIGFFYREMMSVGLVGIGMWPLIAKPNGLSKMRMYRWLFACLSVAVFPTLPVAMGFVDRRLVAVGGITAFLGSVYYIIKNNESEFKETRSSIIQFVQVIFVAIATYLSGYAVDHISVAEQFISWSILGLSTITPLFAPTAVMNRLLTVSLASLSPFILLSISHEIFFVVCLCWLLYEWISLEYELSNTCSSPTNGAHKSTRKPLYHLDFSGEDIIASHNSRQYLETNDIRRAFFFAYLILTGFFGTGNIASINSFNPASVLCFLSVFSPFVMGALMLWKILIPCILITCTLRAIHVITRVPIRALFLLIFLMSDAMALHFFFLVQDYGSWLDIGTSISHYVIVMCMIIFIMLLFGFSHLLTNGRITLRKTVKQN